MEANLDLAQAALSLYDFDPDSEDRGESGGREDSSRGVFADDSGSLSV